MEPLNSVLIFIKPDETHKPPIERVRQAICELIGKSDAVAKIYDLENCVYYVRMKFESDINKLVSNGSQISVDGKPYALVANDIFVKNGRTWLLPQKIWVVLKNRCKRLNKEVESVFVECDIKATKEIEGGPWKIDGNFASVSKCAKEMRSIFLTGARFPIENDDDFAALNRIFETSADAYCNAFQKLSISEQELRRPTPPSNAEFHVSQESEEKCCSICLQPLKGSENELIKLRKCNHEFHKKCFENWLKKKPICPYCTVPIGWQPTGCSFSQAIRFGRDIEGFDGAYGYVEIIYSILDGIQGPEHPNPGFAYKGTKRSAYLPNNERGRKIAQLLKIAFEYGLTFKVGTSLTTGESNVIVWRNSIPHKTSLDGGGAYGYPDPLYLDTVEAKLKNFGIVASLLSNDVC